MPLRLDVKKKLSARSDRVKCVDIHPEEPWILSSLFNGNVYIWNYSNQSLVKTFEVTDLPVRTAKFITRKQWIVAGSDDMFLRVYNYNTMEKIKTIEAHSDYIRCVVVHPTQPYVLSSSDDMLIKLWDWEKNWTNTQVFEGHSHYVMMLTINPKDTNTFASASLDRTIKVWGFGSNSPHFTLEGHEKGVNCVEYYIGGEKPYLISGADDKSVKVWDYQNKTCVQTLEGHTHNVSVVGFHPELPIIITGSEDGTVRIWHAHTYRLEKTLNYGLERVWAAAYLRGTNLLALGYDEGTVMLKLGKEQPAASMDSNGKVIWARHNEIQTVHVKNAVGGSSNDSDNANNNTTTTNIVDGERLQLATKELGNCEVFPQTLQHNPNGRFVVVCGDGEYIIYTALAWRNKSFGSATEFVWSNEAGEYAVRESPSKVKLFRNFKETGSVKLNYSAEGVFGGALLGVRSRESVTLYDWEECRVIRRIDVVPKQIYWSDNGEMMAIACDSAFYILKFNKDLVNQFFANGGETDDEGIEESFEIQQEIPEKVRTAVWVGDCFIYTTANNRLQYCVGGETVTIAHLDRKMYLLGYLPRDNRIYLIDKGYNIVSYTLHLTIINYQTAVLRGDFDTANTILPNIPQDHRNRIAQFLDAQGFKEQALDVSIDPDHRFDLAVSLGKLEVALTIAKEGESEQKWKQLADLALSNAKLDLAEQCLTNAEDLSGLLLLYSSLGNVQGLTQLAATAQEMGKNNIAFMALFLLRRMDDCLDLLCNTGRIPEAAFLARTYLPSQVPRIVQLWRADLHTVNQKAAESLADPAEYQNLFPDLDWALKAEKRFVRRSPVYPASSYLQHVDDLNRDLIEEIKGDSNGIDEDDEEQQQQQPTFNHHHNTNNNVTATTVATPSPAVVSTPSPIVPQTPPTVVSPVVVQQPPKQPSPIASPVVAPRTPVATTNNTVGGSPAASPVVTPRQQQPAAISPIVPTKQASPSPVATPKAQSLISFDDEEEDDDLAKEIEAQMKEEHSSSFVATSATPKQQQQSSLSFDEDDDDLAKQIEASMNDDDFDNF